MGRLINIDTPSKRIGFIIFLAGTALFLILCCKGLLEYNDYAKAVSQAGKWASVISDTFKFSFTNFLFRDHNVWAYSSLLLIIIGCCVMNGVDRKILGWIKGRKDS